MLRPEPEVTLALQFRPYNAAAGSQQDQMALSGPIGGVALGWRERVKKVPAALLAAEEPRKAFTQHSRHAPLLITSPS